MSHSPVPDPAQYARFRELQRLAYSAAEAVARGLEPGVTEREAAARLRHHLVERGVQDWFHAPFAWFGGRTAFGGFKVPLQFFPTRGRLEEGMPFILDCAPVRSGYVADIGYSGCLGANRIHDRLMDDLAAYREPIVEQVRAGRRLSDIYRAADALISEQGYDNRHQVYPGRVIAHQVGLARFRLPRFVAAGSGIRQDRKVTR
ncbi:M24 family metallopeptidase [Saccharopolyspora erythraea]|uniref:M24 family metallopeptidase n=1 Tax=Saccharopolyspora erythraea TaxID=1836 RepID=UPI002012C6B7|nr:M24 family metallopeptidase [Saccharopolyspora erythraea]